MKSCPGPSGEALLALATATAIQLAAGKSADQTAVLGAFFATLGDALSLIAAQRAAAESS